MIARLESFSIQHVPREQNREADQLANQALGAAERAWKRDQAEGQGSLVQDASPGSRSKVAKPLRASATFHKGLLEPHGQLSLFEGEVVDLEIYRKE